MASKTTPAPVKGASVAQLAALVAKLPGQGTVYPSAAALFAAATHGGMQGGQGSNARQQLRALGLGVGRGKRYRITPAQWLQAYKRATAQQASASATAAKATAQGKVRKAPAKGKAPAKATAGK